MTDLLTPDEVEDRLRRCLATRAEAMAPGDGAPWEPGEVGPPGLFALDGPPTRPKSRRSRRPLVAVAAAAATVAAVVGALAAGGDDPGPTRVSSGAGPTTTDTVPHDPTTTVAGPFQQLPNLVAGYQKIGMEPNQYVWLYLTWYPDPRMAERPLGPSEDLTVDGRRARTDQPLPDYPSARDVWVFYDDGVLGVHAGGITRAEVLGVAASVDRLPGTTKFTSVPPAGWRLAEGPRPAPRALPVGEDGKLTDLARKALEAKAKAASGPPTTVAP